MQACIVVLCGAEVWQYITNERPQGKAEQMDGWNLFEEMLDKMGAEKLLEDLAFALSDKELEDNMRFIAQMNDIELDEDALLDELEEELDE
jgi:hypothetical protein|nr:MAG TPA: hypothetical protein [Caudoviricetes sp.]